MQCFICLGNADIPKKLPCCINNFCQDCLDEWLRIRNSCPQCIRPVETAKVKSQPIEQKEGHMIEDQVERHRNRIFHLREVLMMRQSVSSNCKTTFPRANLLYLQEKIPDLEENLYLCQQYLLMGDIAAVGAVLQSMTEQILTLQEVLAGNISIVDQQYSDEEQQYDQFDEQELAMYESRPKRVKKKGGSNGKVKA